MNKIASVRILGPARTWWASSSGALLALALAVLPSPVASDQEQGLSKRYTTVDSNKPVLCLLPGRVRKLGGVQTYLSRRRPAQLTASECEIRGGEYTLYDRANYETALAVWKAEAEQGNAEAYLYVGEIYERGWLGEVDYGAAAKWYAGAVELDSEQAKRRLAYLYENGLGVEKDTDKALSLWRSALGLQEDLVLASELDAAKSASERRIADLLMELEEQNRRTGQLQARLGDAESGLQARERDLREQQAKIVALEAARAEAAGNADPARRREMEQQLAEAQTLADEQQLNIELLEAQLLAQRAQVTASERQAAARERQLAKAQEELLAVSAEGDALLRELAERDATIALLKSDLALTEAALVADRERAAQLEAELAAVESGAETGTEQLRQQLADARDKIAAGEERLIALRSQREQESEAFAEQLSAADLRESQLQAALAESRAQNAELAAELERSETRLGTLDQELARSRGALADTEFELSRLREQLSQQPSSSDAQQLEEEIASKEAAAAALLNERDGLLTALRGVEQERDRLRGELAREVDTRTWLNVELESASRKLARTREDLRLAELSLEDANFTRQTLQQDVRRLEEDLNLARSRSDSDILALRSALSAAREQLAAVSDSRDDLERTALRLESDFEFYSERQSERTLAMRGSAPVPSIPASSVSDRRGNYHAIIIANYDYDYLPDLSSPPFDANRLKQVLEQRYDFQVDVLINLDRSEMYAALARLREFEEDDRVLLYYAGHGRMDEYGEGFWLPVDYRDNRPLTDSISAQDLTQSLQQSSAKHVLLMADSCYSGALTRNGDPVIRKSVPALVKYWLANRSRTVLASGGLKPVLDEGPGGHSVFASALLDALETNDGAINGEMLHASVYSAVRQEAAKLGYLDQKPQFSAIEDAGHENGQFVFLSRG